MTYCLHGEILPWKLSLFSVSILQKISHVRYYGTTGLLLMRSKIHLPQVEHPKFEFHVTLNEDEYQKYVRSKFRYRLGVSQFTPSCLITNTRMSVEIAFEIGHFCTFQTSVTLTVTLDWVYCRVFLIYVPNFVPIGKTLDRWAYIYNEPDFIRSTRRSQLKN